MIPQTCKFKGRRFECGLSISCVLGGGKPLDLCSGGMIWSCCVDRDIHQDSNPTLGAINNASKCFKYIDRIACDRCIVATMSYTRSAILPPIPIGVCIYHLPYAPCNICPYTAVGHSKKKKNDCLQKDTMENCDVKC